MDRYLRSAQDAIDAAAGGLPVQLLSQKRVSGWSIAEILEHLTLAFTTNTASLEKALASGELRARRPALQQILARVLVVDVGYFPRVEAPSMTRPSGTIPADRALSAIRQAIASLDATLTRVGQRFGDDVRVSNHPYFAGMTVPQWRKFHWRHTLHHMKQVRTRSVGR